MFYTDGLAPDTWLILIITAIIKHNPKCYTCAIAQALEMDYTSQTFSVKDIN